ncbi:hypothetical protein ACWEVD_20965 [Nocardia thailandica]|uniref:Transposase n=1 Tax=Nocardia thailandica TaxID=257275 RepID=A0ABW6PQB8_9NOCA|nr:hypothetical protein [Nocardia thailandica]
MTPTDEQSNRPARTLILDPDLGPVQLQTDRVSTVTAIFGTDENRPWRADRPTTD